MKRIGILNKDGFVETEDNELFQLPIKGTDDSGFPEVLINAKEVGGKSEWQRQSIKDYIGMKVEFTTYIEIKYEEILELLEKNIILLICSEEKFLRSIK